MFLSVLFLSILASPTPASAPAQEPSRQFDFWIGEWSVQNRHLQPDGSWKNGTRTRARITPVCGGAAILEEWAGPLGQSFMNGFSLRAWNPDAASWSLVLFWTPTGNGAFGQLSGEFRHGRGEFFTPSNGKSLTRYTFSDALPESVRWDSAASSDGGQTWRTDWIMEFSRTAPAATTTQDQLFEIPWNAGQVSPQPAARALDWMLGDWEGVQVDEKGREREARLKCALLNKDCMVLDLLQTREVGAEDWTESLNVRAFEATSAAWTSWRVSTDDTRLRRSTGVNEDGVLHFKETGPEGVSRVEYLLLSDEEHLVIEEARIEADGSHTVLLSTSLERKR